jgi:hypothetical protein
MHKNRLPQAVALGLVTEATLRHATTTRLHKLILAGVFDSSADNYRSLDMPPGTYVGRLSAHLVCLQAIRHVVCGLPCDDAVHRWGACLPRLSAHLLPQLFSQRVLLPFAGVPGCCQLPEHEALALRAAQSAMTLLQNIGGALPLTGAELAGELFLGGPLANTTGALNGGYAGTPAHTVTLLEGLATELKQAGGSVAFQAGCTNGVQCTDTSQFAAAVAAAMGKVAILAMGIDDSVESEGRDRTSIGLPGYQEDLTSL